jgi:hypothetical protein
MARQLIMVHRQCPSLIASIALYVSFNYVFRLRTKIGESLDLNWLADQTILTMFSSLFLFVTYLS